MRKSKYMGVRVCPETGEPLTRNQYSYSCGVCPHCGHYEDGGTFTHYEIQVGYFELPGFLGWLLGEKRRWVPKEDS